MRLLIVLTLASLLFGCSDPKWKEDKSTPPFKLVAPDGIHVSRESMGDKWPFTVKDGYLRCQGEAILFDSNGKTYAVNGTAKGRNLGRDLHEIWAASPEYKGVKGMESVRKSVGPLIDIAGCVR